MLNVNPFGLNDEQYETLRAVFVNPPRSDISWSKIKNLLEALGGVVREYRGRVCIAMKHRHESRRAIIPRRHQKHASPNEVKYLRYFFLTVGIEVAD